MYTNWDVEIYSQHLTPGITGLNETVESELRRKFKTVHVEQVDIGLNPTTVVDAMGRILVWVLPNVLGPHEQVRQHV